MARVKSGKLLLLLVCTFCIPASRTLWASTDTLPPTDTSFAYSVSHPFTPLSDAVIEKIADQEYEPEEATDYNGFELPPEPPVNTRSGPPRLMSRNGMCGAVAAVAQAHDLPIPFFANLIWQESSFDTGTISRAGAQGIAQFMPKTAVEHGLVNPFEPIHALNVAGKFLRELHDQFGNLGLAAAAYNAGPGRVSRWIAKGGALPRETRNYVLKITGRSADQWKNPEIKTNPEAGLMPAKAPCVEVAKAVESQAKLVRIAKLMTEIAEAAATPPEKKQLADREIGGGKAKHHHKPSAARMAKAAAERSDGKNAKKTSAKKKPSGKAETAKVAAKSQDAAELSSRNRTGKDASSKSKTNEPPKGAGRKGARAALASRPQTEPERPKSASRRKHYRRKPQLAFGRHRPY